jgi:hypothetical protein
VNGVLVGDPLDVNMFKCSNWRLQELTSKNKTFSDQNVVLAYVFPKELRQFKLSK